jgi:hypothetical protein
MLRALPLLLLLGLAGRPVAAQEGGTPPDSAAAPADSTARELISTDGSVSVFKEARPGEGIEGYWWEYDPFTDLQRLTDTRLREQPLDPILDPFGFQLIIPDTIRALRDSVRAVADSVISARIEINTTFDPKLRSTYRELKDAYEFSNKIDAAFPLTRRGNVVVTVDDQNRYNSSTKRADDGLNLASNFNYNVSASTRSTLALNFEDNQLERDGVEESNSQNKGLTGRILVNRPVAGGFTLDTGVGLGLSQRTYTTLVTDGKATQLSPNWSLKTTRQLPGGTLGFDYTGDYGRARRREVRTFTQADSTGTLREVTETTETKDDNFSNRGGANFYWTFNQDWNTRLTGNLSQDRFQYISQADSVQGQQETRVRAAQDVTWNLVGKPVQKFEVKTNVAWRRNQTEYDLEAGRFARTTTRSGKADLIYDPWSTGRFKATFDRSLENRDYLTAQAGLVDKKSIIADWRQDVTPRIELTSAYTLRLDSYQFDDPEANTGDRDLRTQRGTFTVRYNPMSVLSTSVKMDIRKDESVNIHPSRSGDNKTDYVYIVTPGYSIRLGAATINGDFTANARYNVFDFDENRNSLTRRFSTQQRWQQKVNERVSSELLFTYEFSDEGSYRPSPVDGIRRYSRSREIFRYRLDTSLLYNPWSWLRLRATYRTDGDDQYSVNMNERQQTTELRTYELSFGASVKRRILKTIQINLEITQSQKEGDRVSDVDRNFYNIRATLEYQPFRPPPAPPGGNGGRNGAGGGE